MDSDGLANANLDHLFFLPFPENIFMAAPQGYWFGKDGVTIGTYVMGTDYGPPMKPFFIKIPKFWARADKLGR